jgi:hypothetical protein
MRGCFFTAIACHGKIDHVNVAMPRKKSKRAKRKLEKLKLEGQSPGRQGASKYVKKISNVFSKLIKYINEWNEIELSSQQTFSSISNLSERLPMLRDLCKVHYGRDDISDPIDAKNIVNEVGRSLYSLDPENEKSAGNESGVSNPSSKTVNIGNKKFGVLHEFEGVGLKLFTRHLKEIERSWRNLRVEIDGFYSSVKKMQLLLPQFHDILATIVSASDEADDNVDIDYYIVTLENIIQMFSEEYWRKFDLVRIDSIENYNVESFNKIGADFNGKTSANSCLQWHFIDDALSKIVHNFS